MSAETNDTAPEQGPNKDAVLFSLDAVLSRQLAREQAHPLTLLRELVSNAASREVKANEVRITCFQHPDTGWAFRVQDDGIGMSCTGNSENPGKLDRFLALGMSALPGLSADEFSYRGLGSKLAFRSSYIEIETWTGMNSFAKVVIGAPWESLQQSKPVKPRPLFYEMRPEPGQKPGTKITVYGHLPQTQIFAFEDIRNYLLHRTFVGFTRERTDPPNIRLTVGKRTEEIAFGFPVLARMKGPAPEGAVFVQELQRTQPVAGQAAAVTVKLHGIYSVEAERFGISPAWGSAGVVLSLGGIPYFSLDLDRCTGGRGLSAVPGAGGVCLIAECDDVEPVMNLSRSGLEDGPEKEAFEACLSQLLKDIEASESWRRLADPPAAPASAPVPRAPAPQVQQDPEAASAKKREWVCVEERLLCRKPESAADIVGLVSKLEAMCRLPLARFESLGHGPSAGELVAHIQETEDGEVERFVTLECAGLLADLKPPDQPSARQRTILCWDIVPDGGIAAKATELPFKCLAGCNGQTVRIYVVSRIPGIQIASVNESAM